MSNRVICTVKLHVILKCCVFTSEYCWVCREQWPEVFALILETVWGTDATVCTAYYCRLFLEMVKWLQSWKKAVSLERWQRGFPLHYISNLHCTCAGEPGPWCSVWRYSESQDPLRPPSSLQEEHYWYHPTLPREWGLLMLTQHTLTHHARGIRYGGGTCTQSGLQLDRRKCSFYSLHARTAILGRGVFIGCPLCLFIYTLQNLTVYLKTSYQATTTYYYCSLTEAVCCCLTILLRWKLVMVPILTVSTNSTVSTKMKSEIQRRCDEAFSAYSNQEPVMEDGEEGGKLTHQPSSTSTPLTFSQRFYTTDLQFLHYETWDYDNACIKILRSFNLLMLDFAMGVTAISLGINVLVQDILLLG